MGAHGGRLTEARSYLLNLWDRSPGSGEVNLDLAHISARTGVSRQSELMALMTRIAGGFGL